LRALVRRRESLLQLQQQETNRLTSGEDAPLVVASLQAVLEVIQTELASIQQAIGDQVASDPELKRQNALVDSIPGIGPTTAAALLGEIDFSLYASPRQLVAQAGLNPRQRQSGTSIHGRPRISKQGSSQLRRILFFPAIVAMRANPAVHALAIRLADKGKAKMVIVCACMRKLLHIVYGVLKHGLPFDPKHAKPQVQQLQPA
jgi:transposase